MRMIGFIALLIVLFLSLFKIGGAELNNNVLAIALLLTLVTLFSDLKEFNFWGLQGTAKEEKKLKELKEKDADAIAPGKLPEVTPARLPQILKQETVTDDGTGKEGLLRYVYEIERFLRFAASILTNKKSIGTLPDLKEIISILRKKGFLTQNGQEQFESLLWIKNNLILGREKELSSQVMKDGNEIAKGLYQELKDWVDTAVKK
ncbi:MAG: hypothetical protein Q7S61_05520 [bacterium]|nr:hypothetical protein [bacterium]